MMTAKGYHLITKVGIFKLKYMAEPSDNELYPAELLSYTFN